jgi:hypothetical protein
MTIGNFTRQSLESRATALAELIIDSFNDIEKLRNRCAAELAAGTFEGADFYQGAPGTPNAISKGNVLGFLDDMHAVYMGLQGQQLSQLDYRRYLNFLIGP